MNTHDTTRCCPAGECDFSQDNVRTILNHIRWCRKSGVDPVESAHSALTAKDSAPVWDGASRDYDSGTAGDDDILSVVAVLQAMDGGAKGVRAVCKRLCPYSLGE